VYRGSGRREDIQVQIQTFQELALRRGPAFKDGLSGFQLLEIGNESQGILKDDEGFVGLRELFHDRDE